MTAPRLPCRLSAWRPLIAVTFVASLGCLSACAGGGTASSNVVAPSPVVPAAAPVPAAVLTISRAHAIASPTPPGGLNFYYDVRFLLTETSGKSGATIQRVEVSGGSAAATTITDVRCWRDTIRVEPGGTLDAFDGGEVTMSYCAPDAGGNVDSGTVMLAVTFTDDAGVSGIVRATATVAR